MEYKLKDKISLGLIEGVTLDYKPIFVLDSLQVYLTPFTNNAILEKEKTKWIGIDSWLYQEGDSWLFDPKNNMLKYACFVMPEKNKIPNNIDFIFNSIRVEGMLTLSNDPIEFELESMMYRFYSIEHSALLCFNDNLLASSGSLKEVVLAENISMIFTKDGYCGWKLRNPELYLVENLDSRLPNTNDTSEFVKDCLFKALNFFEDRNFDLMDDKDEDFLRQVSQLYLKIHSSRYSKNASLEVIATWLYSVADRYYPENMIKESFRQ